MQALAYAQGSEIHLGPGQERYLPHEAWHVVQQKQGRVPVTGSVNAIALNDSPNLEAEANRMGRKGKSFKPLTQVAPPNKGRGRFPTLPAGEQLSSFVRNELF
jgi:hypothetical protein